MYFFELSVVTSFALAIYGYGAAELRGAFTYVVANLLGSVLFLTAAAIVYHMAGTLDLVALSQRAGEDEARHAAISAAALIFAADFGQAGPVPDSSGWVPALYSHALPPVAAALSGALINIGGLWPAALRLPVRPGRPRGCRGGVLLLLGAARRSSYGSLAAARRNGAGGDRRLCRDRPGRICRAGRRNRRPGRRGRRGGGSNAVLAGSIEKEPPCSSGWKAQGWRGRFATLAAALGMAGLPLTLGFLAKIALMRARPGGSWRMAAEPAP